MLGQTAQAVWVELGAHKYGALREEGEGKKKPALPCSFARLLDTVKEIVLGLQVKFVTCSVSYPYYYRRCPLLLLSLLPPLDPSILRLRSVLSRSLDFNCARVRALHSLYYTGLPIEKSSSDIARRIY